MCLVCLANRLLRAFDEIRVFFLGAVFHWPDAVKPSSLPPLCSVQLRSPSGPAGCDRRLLGQWLWAPMKPRNGLRQNIKETSHG